MTAYPGKTQMTLGQLCSTLWDSQSQTDVIQPRDCSDASCFEMQCISLLHHLGAMTNIYIFFTEH